MGREGVEHVALGADFNVVGIREGAEGVRLRLLRTEHADDPFTLPGHGTEEQRVDDRERRGVGADTECQHDDGDGGEAGSLCEGPDGVAKVLNEAHFRHV